jgi:alpha-tubulin suppressor-like RCC1 family protein
MCAGGSFRCKSTQNILPVSVAAVCEGSSANHNCMISNEGQVKCWGLNDYGQLGYGDTTQRNSPPSTFVDIGAGVVAKQIVCGERHTCVLTTTGNIKCWGDNSMGQLGVGSNPQPVYSPSAYVGLGTGVTAAQMSAGSYHNCFASASRQLKCWGRNVEGQLGTGSGLSYELVPSSFIDMRSTNDVLQVVCGRAHTCAINWGQKIQCWGDGTYGQLGEGAWTSRAYPLNTVSIGSLTAKQLSAGLDHTCALLSDNNVRCWGRNNNAQLGVINTGNQNTAGQVVNYGPVGNGLAVYVAAGGAYTCWVVSAGNVQCWGLGTYGQLGLESSSTRYAALDLVNIGSGLYARKMSASVSSSCVLLTDNTVKCWGRNSFGQLGTGVSTAINIGDDAGEMGNNLPRLNFGTVDLSVVCSPPSPGTGCSACSAGTFSTEGSTACLSCPAGSYSSAAQSTTCTNCIAGKFSSVVGAQDPSVCTNCLRGSYASTQGSSACTNCTIGTYSDLLGSNSNSTCVKCPAGTYSPRSGSSTCLTCPGGSYSAADGSTSCATCKSGTASTL